VKQTYLFDCRIFAFLLLVFSMSELTAQHDDAFEPDEDTLGAALRNQDDIPILMDVIADQASVSQEAHFSKSFDELNKSDSVPVDIVTSASFSQELISKAITEVLEKRLPELVAEVMQKLNSVETSKKAD
jgi:hypothetical protein